MHVQTFNFSSKQHFLDRFIHSNQYDCDESQRLKRGTNGITNEKGFIPGEQQIFHHSGWRELGLG